MNDGADTGTGTGGREKPRCQVLFRVIDTLRNRVLQELGRSFLRTLERPRSADTTQPGKDCRFRHAGLPQTSKQSGQSSRYRDFRKADTCAKNGSQTSLVLGRPSRVCAFAGLARSRSSAKPGTSRYAERAKRRKRKERRRRPESLGQRTRDRTFIVRIGRQGALSSVTYRPDSLTGRVFIGLRQQRRETESPTLREPGGARQYAPR